VAKAMFGLGSPKGVRSKVGDCSYSLSLLLMLGSGALRAHEENVNLLGKTLKLRGNVGEISGVN
jgi:hypothetical protein